MRPAINDASMTLIDVRTLLSFRLQTHFAGKHKARGETVFKFEVGLKLKLSRAAGPENQNVDNPVNSMNR